MSSEQRKRTRIYGQFPVTVEVAAGSVTMMTRNVSLKGLLCQKDASSALLAAGDGCLIHLHLSDFLELAIEGNIVRVSDQDVAIDFLSFEADTYMHLRNIVRYAADDPDSIDEEQVLRPFEE